MIRKLPGSSDASAIDIYRLQMQCDRVRAENELHSIDHQDEESVAQLVARIPCGSGVDDCAESANRFSSLSLIGVGAFGLVFCCADADQGGKRVAVKMMRPSRQYDRVARERFHEEIRVMSEFNHPGIVRVFGTGTIDQLPYLITEYADAGSVDCLIYDTTDLITPRQAAWLVNRIAEAVEEAHSTAILHRDIKPGNILLRREAPELSEGLGLWPLLTDFGLSKKLGPETNMLLTIEGEVLGTLSYMSPEQVRGQPLKTQSDLFSIGIILHELAYGRHPFLEESDFQTRKNIVHSAPLKPTGSARCVPALLDAIISKCLQKDPEDRYLHASDLANDLDHYLQGEPISVSPPTLWQSLGRLVDNHRLASTFIGTLLSCLIGGILLLSREWRVQRELARTSQALADDREKISQLFLQSMRVTNSGINDTILASQRVPSSALLQTLNAQIPLLEKALQLATSDSMLIRQLEIMYHYKSLCHVDGMSNGKKPDGKTHRTEAVTARRKSLDYIELLIQRAPYDQTLQVSRINGLYQLAVILDHEMERPERRVIEKRAIEYSEAFLRECPNHQDVLETAIQLKFNQTSEGSLETSEERIHTLREISEIALALLRENPSKSTLLTYAIDILTRRGCLLLKMDREAEAFIDFDRLDQEADSRQELFRNGWRNNEALFESFISRSEALIQAGYLDKASATTDRWRDWVTRQNIDNFSIVRGLRFQRVEFALLFPEYYRWIAHSELDPERAGRARGLLIDRIAQCHAISSKELAAVLEVLVARGSVSEAARNLLAEVRERFPDL